MYTFDLLEVKALSIGKECLSCHILALADHIHRERVPVG